MNFNKNSSFWEVLPDPPREHPGIGMWGSLNKYIFRWDFRGFPRILVNFIPPYPGVSTLRAKFRHFFIESGKFSATPASQNRPKSRFFRHQKHRWKTPTFFFSEKVRFSGFFPKSGTFEKLSFFFFVWRD